ncbi:hypothetical protein MLD38_024758 [Melastoma candidum]|uniref:Uncharacterized protein n=1 Tax=Melastoma candidum TaxID=119954 RepID=A0ACB9NTA3_9MYRT|nr:hypothetical protein MLD38_024758 [Melastoma candidum]
MCDNMTPFNLPILFYCPCSDLPFLSSWIIVVDRVGFAFASYQIFLHLPELATLRRMSEAVPVKINTKAYCRPHPAKNCACQKSIGCNPCWAHSLLDTYTWNKDLLGY